MMDTPMKDGKRCHRVTDTPTPNEKKKAKTGTNRETANTKSPRRKLQYSSAAERIEEIDSPPSRFRAVVRRVARKFERHSWSNEDDFALVQFVALHKDVQTSEVEWPAMNKDNIYWKEAAEFVQTLCGTSYKRTAQSVRQRVVNYMRNEYNTVDDAETAMGITSETYLEEEGDMGIHTTAPIVHVNLDNNKVPDKILHQVGKLTPKQSANLVCQLLQGVEENLENLLQIIQNMSHECQLRITEGALCELASKKYGLTSHLKGFIDVACKAMHELEVSNKPNLVLKFCQSIATKREDGKTSMFPLYAMPFGLVQYQIEFFSSINVQEVRETEDYRLWLETMEAEFGGGKFKRLFRGPMWSGCSREDIGYTMKAKVNVACISTKTQTKRSRADEYSTKPEVQVEALKMLKESCNGDDGRFWIKIDGTDVKPALLESMKKQWNGDVDLGDGHLQSLRQQLYDQRVALCISIKEADTRQEIEQKIIKIISNLEDDIKFLAGGLHSASKLFREKMTKATSSEETLRCLNWEVVEYQVLLEQSTNWKSLFEDLLGELNPAVNPPQVNAVKRVLKESDVDFNTYLRNIFKKLRQPAASHVLVLMVSDERRDMKPYALPVQYIPYYSLKDQYIRDFTKILKQHMTQMGLQVVGTVTDGEFLTLRSRGETRALHLWQIIHDAKQSVAKMSQQTILNMLLQTGVQLDGTPIVRNKNEAIPNDVILSLFNLQFVHHLSLGDAITNVRGKLVPQGYTPWPFRRDTPESQLDMLRSIVATYILRHSISEIEKKHGADFKSHLYIPEVDPTTGIPHHERGDHNHILKRVALCTRKGSNPDLDFQAFLEAMRAPQTGLTYTALAGKRKQSVPDAERLLSYHVADFFREKGYEREYEYVKIIAQWHEASDGRGISQIQRCRFNYQMLNYILDEWMPWHKNDYDFSKIDINRPVENIRGFTREVIIEITGNIESQEQRRQQTGVVGFPEHPRAGSTDDLECFFGITHSHLGQVFGLKEFKERWPKLVREFSKRLSAQLPFYYWTANERYKEGSLCSFDEKPGDDNDDDDDDSEDNSDDSIVPRPLRLHKLRRNLRESVSCFVAGRSFLPPRNARTVSQENHRPKAGVPPPSGFLFSIDERDEQ